jgi:hypothetical protein
MKSGVRDGVLEICQTIAVTSSVVSRNLPNPRQVTSPGCYLRRRKVRQCWYVLHHSITLVVILVRI